VPTLKKTIAVYSENHKKHVTLLCKQTAELLRPLKRVVHIITTGL
jgi:hypothetical protein